MCDKVDDEKGKMEIHMLMQSNTFRISDLPEKRFVSRPDLCLDPVTNKENFEMSSSLLETFSKRVLTRLCSRTYSRYYAAPSGKRFRSLVEVQKFLSEHPEYVEAGVQLSQFSFQIPRPLQENYVRKRPKLPTLDPNSGGTSGLLEPPSLVNPVAWASPDQNTDLQLGGPGFSTESLSSEPINRPKKRANKPSNESTSNHVLAYDHQQTMNVSEPSPPIAVIDNM